MFSAFIPIPRSNYLPYNQANVLKNPLPPTQCLNYIHVLYFEQFNKLFLKYNSQIYFFLKLPGLSHCTTEPHITFFI